MGEVKRHGFISETDKDGKPYVRVFEHPNGCYVRSDDYATLEAERDALRAEVAKLRAACAAKDQAIRRIFTPGNLSPETRAFVEAALSTDADKNYIDATGAVEAVVSKFPAFDAAKIMVQQEVPDEWAGSRVLIVRVP